MPPVVSDDIGKTDPLFEGKARFYLLTEDYSSHCENCEVGIVASLLYLARLNDVELVSDPANKYEVIPVA